VTRAARVSLTAPALLAAALSGQGLQAQQDAVYPDFRNATFFGLGYVVNVPNVYSGISAVALSSGVLGGAGLYADVKFSTDSPGNDPYLIPGVTAQEAEILWADELGTEKSAYLSVNLALVFAITPELGLYAGAGYTDEKHYREYWDEAQERGDLGFYWVADPEGTGARINLLGGALFRLHKHLFMVLGLEAQPRGATVGLSLALPR
jgi:hypothetical protein